MTVCECSRVKF
ncbi:hypothetical protein VCHC62B1_3263A, partial [Vibrio cholerae HC-62B1]